jgi:hypothetical protein
VDARRTLKSGLPAGLTNELDGLIGALLPVDEGGANPIARHRLERVLGRGSLFVTFQSTRIDPRGAVPYAVKILRPSLARILPRDARVLTSEQARSLAILNDRLPPHPHVVRLLEAGELARDAARSIDATVPWLALEHVPGGSR